MKASRKSLAVRDSRRDIGAEFIQTVTALKAGKIGRRSPSGAAETLLRIVARLPEVLGDLV